VLGCEFEEGVLEVAVLGLVVGNADLVGQVEALGGEGHAKAVEEVVQLHVL